MELNHRDKNERIKYAKNIVKCHMDFVSDGAPKYHEMLEFLNDHMPNSVNDIEKLHEQWETLNKEYIDGKMDWDKFTDTIESWTVKALELYDRTLSNIH